MKTAIDTLVFSDSHLGSPNCRPKTLLQVLEWYDYKQLVIAGDLYNGDGYICDKQWKIIDHIRKNRIKATLVLGNHDPDEDDIKQMLGIEAVKKLVWQEHGKIFRIEHGQHLDKMCFIFSEPWIDWACLKIIALLHLHVETKKWQTRIHDAFCLNFAKKAIRQAKRHKQNNQADIVTILGHIHRPAHVRRHGIEYINCGSFMEDVCSYVTIHGGEAKLHHLPSID